MFHRDSVILNYRIMRDQYGTVIRDPREYAVLMLVLLDRPVESYKVPPGRDWCISKRMRMRPESILVAQPSESSLDFCTVEWRSGLQATHHICEDHDVWIQWE